MMPLNPPATTLADLPTYTAPDVPTFTYRVLDSEVHEARTETARMVGALVPADHLDDLISCVSELVTNGIRAARDYATSRGWSWHYTDTPVHLGITCGPRWTRLDVRDPDRSVPVPSMTDPLSESGRGLLIVGMIASDLWPTVHADHKVMHAVIAQPGVELTETDLLEARQ